MRRAIALPRWKKSKALTADPSLAKLRKAKELPTCAKSRSATEEPNRAAPVTARHAHASEPEDPELAAEIDRQLGDRES